MSTPAKRLRKSVVPAEIPVEVQTNIDNEEEDEANLYEDEEGAYRVGDIYIPPPIKPYCSSESKGSRLIITQIMNTDFKSYAGDVPLGPFCHRFHSIIGPNGSGKSNVIDSMLFVFGYRANKIRCKKLSVLIHNSKQYAHVNSCRVAVHFAKIEDKDDGSYEIVPNSEFIIAREAFRNNSSFYTINDRRVHFREVAILLKKHNVDLDHNRFLILQGEVESIAMMKPKGLTENECGHLEYLEDIIGTTRYKEPLQKILAKVEILCDERNEKQNRCKMAEREINDLKQPMEEAVSYLKLENEFTRTRNMLFQLYLYDNDKKLKEYTTECDEKTNILKEHDDKIDAIAKERTEKEEKIKEELANHDRIVKKKEEYEQMKKNAVSKHDEIQSSMTETNKRRKQIGGQLKKKEEELEELKRVPAKNKKEITELEKKVDRYTKEKTTADEMLQENLLKLQDQIKPLSDKKDKLEASLVDVQVKNDNAKGDLQLAEAELELVQQNESTEKKKFEIFKYSIGESKRNLAERQTALKELEENIPEIKAEIAECKSLVANYIAKEETLKKEVHNLRVTIDDKTSTMQQARYHTKVVDYLMRKKMEGELPGVLGRLGDLGGIDKKYDVAISTCCGRLDNIVVDTVATGQQCIDSLKRNNVGRTTFIALEKMDRYASQSRNRIQTPENVPRLFDLVHFEDERLTGAFYFALRDTLVATDLTQASRIAYSGQRYRVVSLNGDVIEMVGTMSGGGRSQFRGKMGETVKTKTSSNDTSLTGGSTSNDVRKMQEQAQKLQEEINYLQQMQGEKTSRMNELTALLRTKESQLKKFITDVSTYAQQIPALEEQLEEQRNIMNQTRSDPIKVAELQNLIVTRKEIFEKCSADTKKITDKIEVVTREIKAITEEKIESIQNSIVSMNKHITKLTKNILQLKVDITTSERNVTKAEENIVTMNEDIEKAKADLLAMAEERDQAEKDIAELEERLKEIIKEISETQSDSVGIKKEIIALQKQESDNKLKRIEMDQQIQMILKAIRDLKAKVPHFKNKLEPLKLQNIPNEDPPEPLKTYVEEEMATYKLDDIQYKVTLQEESLKAKTPNLNVIEEYQRKMDVYLDRIKILEEVTNKRNTMRTLFDDVKKRRYTEFMQGFTIITRKLKEMYQMITQGGNAELELVDSMDPFSEGISFSVRPPRKSWKNISNLSGGEKTLSSLALVFALHYYKPSPLYFMDEIDAALDFKNVSIVANYIKDRTKNAQFIIISLRSNMFELADFLTGIYKVDDCTDSLTIENTPPKTMGTASQQFAVNTQTTQRTQQVENVQEPLSPVEAEFSMLVSPTQQLETEPELLSPVETEFPMMVSPVHHETSAENMYSPANAFESTSFGAASLDGEIDK